MKGNLLQGDIVVSNKKRLIEFRNQLLEETYDGKNANFEIIIPKTKLISFGVETTEGVTAKNGVLIRNSGFVPNYLGPNSCRYDFEREIIACRHLNTILLLSSLLDVVDRYYSTKIGMDFLKAGIFNVTSFEETWFQCRNGLLIPDNRLDLETFRDAFVYGGITYDVKDSWLRKDVVKMNALKKLGLDLNDVVINTKILGVQKVLRPPRRK